jgi:hypothetical protein
VFGQTSSGFGAFGQPAFGQPTGSPSQSSAG